MKIFMDHIPSARSGDWCVNDLIIPAQSATDNAPAGEYKVLTYKDQIVMSNLPGQVEARKSFLIRAHGSVVLNGLGLGMTLTELINRENCRKIVVIEKNIDVIRLVAPYLKHYRGVEIIHADAFDWKPDSYHYYFVWHDIWNRPAAANVPEIRRLKRKWKLRAEWQGAAFEDESATLLATLKKGMADDFRIGSLQPTG